MLYEFYRGSRAAEETKHINSEYQLVTSDLKDIVTASQNISKYIVKEN